MRWHSKIMAAHLTVTDAVSHYSRMKSERYFVWAEEDRADLIAESVHTERTVSGTTDFFTKTEFDPWAEAIEQAFDLYHIAWRKLSTQHETDTGFIHHEWEWSVIDGKDGF